MFFPLYIFSVSFNIVPVSCFPLYIFPVYYLPLYIFSVYCIPLYISPFYCFPLYFFPVYCFPFYIFPVYCFPVYCFPWAISCLVQHILGSACRGDIISVLIMFTTKHTVLNTEYIADAFNNLKPLLYLHSQLF